MGMPGPFSPNCVFNDVVVKRSTTKKVDKNIAKHRKMAFVNKLLNEERENNMNIKGLQTAEANIENDKYLKDEKFEIIYQHSININVMLDALESSIFIKKNELIGSTPATRDDPDKVENSLGGWLGIIISKQEESVKVCERIQAIIDLL